ncbi:MAG: phosphopantetheine-binding protein [Bacillota bacterium]|nr:phosphopantetheine-binding protein [Bacillota bacterium]
MNIKAKVRKFMERFFRNQEIADDENIFEKNFINSLFAMQLVLFIEKEFGVEISNDDLDLEKFKSINSICELIESKIN